MSTSSPAAQPQPEAPGRKAAEVLLQDTNSRCPECHAQFCSKEELAAHFQEVKAAFSTVSLTLVCVFRNVKAYVAVGFGPMRAPQSH